MEHHKDFITACDFFHVEVWTAVTYSVFFLMQLATRQVHIAGIRANPHGRYMCQIARNLTMADWGWLNGQEYLIMDRDPLFTSDFRQILQDAGVKPVRLPPRSPNMNALAERFVRTIKDECLSKMVFFSEASLKRAIDEFVDHYHHERPHQGLDNITPLPTCDQPSNGAIRCQNRLGGLLKHYYREAA